MDLDGIAALELAAPFISFVNYAFFCGNQLTNRHLLRPWLDFAGSSWKTGFHSVDSDRLQSDQHKERIFLGGFDQHSRPADEAQDTLF